MGGGEAAPEDTDFEQQILSLYRTLIKAYGWSLRELDETNLETLIDYLCFKDPNTRVINGREYRRAASAPKWL